jgi:hypothetical protein
MEETTPSPTETAGPVEARTDVQLARALDALLALEPPVDGIAPMPEHFDRVRRLTPDAPRTALTRALDEAMHRQSELRDETRRHEAAIAALRRDAARALSDAQRALETAIATDGPATSSERPRDVAA